jgi:hypothetical protein
MDLFYKENKFNNLLEFFWYTCSYLDNYSRKKRFG